MTEFDFYLLDTNTVSYLVNNRSPAARAKYLDLAGRARIGLSAITEAEILYGLEKMPAAYRLQQVYTAFLAEVEILPWDTEEAQVYSKVRTMMEAKGKSLARMDLLIASHAIATGATLVSHDKAFVQLVPMLKLTDWATDIA